MESLLVTNHFCSVLWRVPLETKHLHTGCFEVLPDVILDEHIVGWDGRRGLKTLQA